jgi:hypothetical protein
MADSEEEVGSMDASLNSKNKTLSPADRRSHHYHHHQGEHPPLLHPYLIHIIFIPV